MNEILHQHGVCTHNWSSLRCGLNDVCAHGLLAMRLFGGVGGGCGNGDEQKWPNAVLISVLKCLLCMKFIPLHTLDLLSFTSPYN